jgi:hypothetical protein
MMVKCMTGPDACVVVSNGGVHPRWTMAIWSAINSPAMRTHTVILPPTLGCRVWAYYVSKALSARW